MHVDKLGRYRIVKELGRGSMGRVFLAHDPEIDRRVAVKTIHIFSALPESERRQARERFLSEVRAAGKLLHPGVVAIFDVGEEEGVPYLAMEYVEGQTLDAFCRAESRLPPRTVIELVARAAEALDYAHRAGIVHRDVKPANIFRVGETAVKIMDFGLAKEPQSHLTQDGALLGTPSYMSPEQVRGDPVDARSDLFSLGVVLYEMLTGSKPFKGETVSSVLYRIVNEEPRDISAIERDVPGALSAFLKRALHKRPGERFATGAEFARALRAAGDRVASPSPRAVPPPATPDHPSRAALPPAAAPRRRSRMPFIAGAALVFVALAAAAFYYRDHLRGVVARKDSAPGAAWLETRVRTEPPGLPVLLDGEPLPGPVVRFQAAGVGRALTVEQDCRRVEHRLTPEDAGREVVLVPDPVHVDVTVDPGVAGATVRLNGDAVGPAPASVSLDLCEDNRIELDAEGYYPSTAMLPPGTTPLEARTRLAELGLERIPLGRLVLPSTSTPVAFLVDGKTVEPAPGGIELTSGTHEVRAVSERYWVNVTTRVEVPPGGTAEPRFEIPGLSLLVVQAFPANCKVYLRRPGGRWTYLDTTPTRKRIAAGSYEVRVQFVPTGETRERTVKLEPEQRTPVRFSFAGARR